MEVMGILHRFKSAIAEQRAAKCRPADLEEMLATVSPYATLLRTPKPGLGLPDGPFLDFLRRFHGHSTLNVSSGHLFSRFVLSFI